MTLRLQLLSTAQDAHILDLLHYVQALVGAAAGVKARWWAKGWGKTRTYPDLVALSAALTLERVNEVELRVEPRTPLPLGTEGLVLRSFAGRLEVSPTCSLWGAVSGYTLPKHADEARRASHESRQVALKWSGVSACPTLLEVLFTLDSPAEADCMKLLWHALPRVLPALRGWASVSGGVEPPSDFPSPNALQDLAPWPRAYQLLGPAFDALRPIVIGPLQACTELARATDGEAVAVEAPLGSGAADLGYAWLRSSPLGHLAADARGGKWLVPRDETTRPRPVQAEYGEFRVGPSVLFTQARWRELTSAGCLPTLPPGFGYFPLVERKYTDLLGMNADSVPVDLGQENATAVMQIAIDQAFDALAHCNDTRERVWRSHEEVYRRSLIGATEKLAFLREWLGSPQVSMRHESRG